MACGTCWRKASGGVSDGDAAHPHYCYGGLWKNKSRGAAPGSSAGVAAAANADADLDAATVAEEADAA